MLGANSPIRLTQLALAAACAPSLCYLIDALPDTWQLDAPAKFAVLSLAATAFIGGLAINFYAERELERGIAAKAWPQQQIQSALDWIKRPAIHYAPPVVVMLYLTVFVFDLVTHRKVGTLVLTILPILAVTRLTNRLKPLPTPRLPRTEPPAPIHSSHWGAV